MVSTNNAQPTSLGQHLRALRHTLGWSLREVERRSGGHIRNAYLSQVETGRRTSPSGDFLATLADVYGVDFWQLLAFAGWIPMDQAHNPRRPTPAPTGSDLLPRALYEDLTPDEVEEVIHYIKFIKQRRRRIRPTAAPPSLEAQTEGRHTADPRPQETG